MTEEEKRRRNRISAAKYKASKKGQAVTKQYYKDNKERCLSDNKEYREANKEKEALRHRKWYDKTIGYKPCDWAHPGTYNITNAERHKEEWLKQDLTIYKLEIVDDDGTIFYKVGLTTNLKGRIHKIPYNVKVIKTLEIDKHEAVYFEQNYLNGVTKYKPLRHFKGYTECFVK